MYLMIIYIKNRLHFITLALSISYNIYIKILVEHAKIHTRKIERRDGEQLVILRTGRSSSAGGAANCCEKCNSNFTFN